MPKSLSKISNVLANNEVSVVLKLKCKHQIFSKTSVLSTEQYNTVRYCTIQYSGVEILSCLLNILTYFCPFCLALFPINIEPTSGQFDLFSPVLSCSLYTLYTIQFQFNQTFTRFTCICIK